MPELAIRRSNAILPSGCFTSETHGFKPVYTNRRSSFPHFSQQPIFGG